MANIRKANKKSSSLAKAHNSLSEDIYAELVDEDEDEVQYWKYYFQAKEALSSLRDFKLIISSTLPKGYRWYKVCDKPLNGLKDLSNGLTKYLNPRLTSDDFDVLQDQIRQLPPCHDFDLFKYILPLISLGEGDSRSKIRKAISQDLAMHTKTGVSIDLLHATKISEHPPEYVVSFIPEVDQFPESLTKSGLTYHDFLYYFYGKAERDSYALHVGRAGTGPQNSKLAGEPSALEHSYRNALIIQGMPLVGKSWANEWLVSGFEFCQMTTAVLQDLGTRFGHGDWLTANWAYADDTTTKMLLSFYQSPILKTACSSGLVKSETKGVDSIDIKALCAAVLLANDTDARDTAKADSGNANRIRTLVTTDIETLRGFKYPKTSSMHGDVGCMPAEVVKRLCKRYDVEQDLLAAYFIRLSVDYFRSFKLKGMLAKINDLGDKLYAQNNSQCIQFLINAAVFSALILEQHDSASFTWVKKYDSAVNSMRFLMGSLVNFASIRCAKQGTALFNVRIALYLDYVEQGRPMTHPYRGFEAYGYLAINSLADKIDLNANKFYSAGADSIQSSFLLSKIFSDLADTQGVSSQFNLPTLHGSLRSALKISWGSLRATLLRVTTFIDRESEGTFESSNLYNQAASSLRAANCMDSEYTIKPNATYAEMTYTIKGGLKQFADAQYQLIAEQEQEEQDQEDDDSRYRE